MTTDQDQPNDVLLQTLLDQQTAITAKIADFDSKLASLQADFDAKCAVVEEQRSADVLILARTAKMLAIHRGEEPVTAAAGRKRANTKHTKTDSVTDEDRKAAKRAAAARHQAKKKAEAAAAAVPSPKPVASPSKTKKTA
jgi:hypothetical protein